MRTKTLGRPITDDPKAEKSRKYFADRYQRQKAAAAPTPRIVRKKQRPDPHKVEVRMLQVAERMSHKPYHATSVDWWCGTRASQ